MQHDEEAVRPVAAENGFGRHGLTWDEHSATLGSVHKGVTHRLRRSSAGEPIPLPASSSQP
jgi:hypothetical protein